MNRITLSLFALIAGVMMLISCGGGGDIKGNANAFISAMNKLDIKTAKAYASTASKASLDKMEEQLKTLTPDQKKQFDDEVAKRSKTTITIKDVKENGDIATVTFSTSDEPSRVDSLPMVKQDGKWLADFKMF